MQEFAAERHPLFGNWTLERESGRSCGFQCERALLNHFFEIIQTKLDLLVKSPFFSHGNGQLQNFDVVKRLFQDDQPI